MRATQSQPASAGGSKVTRLRVQRALQPDASALDEKLERFGVKVACVAHADDPVPVQPHLEDLLRAETDADEDDALILSDFDDEQ